LSRDHLEDHKLDKRHREDKSIIILSRDHLEDHKLDKQHHEDKSIMILSRDHLEDHKRDKQHREDRLHRGKKHLHSVILERISIQWETQLWLRYLLGFFYTNSTEYNAGMYPTKNADDLKLFLVVHWNIILYERKNKQFKSNSVQSSLKSHPLKVDLFV